MAIEEFTVCYANRLGVKVGAVADSLTEIGSDNLKTFLTWFRGLGEADRQILIWGATTTVTLLVKIFEKVIGDIAAGALIALFSALTTVSLLAFVNSLIDCEDKL